MTRTADRDRPLASLNFTGRGGQLIGVAALVIAYSARIPGQCACETAQ